MKIAGKFFDSRSSASRKAQAEITGKSASIYIDGVCVVENQKIISIQNDKDIYLAGNRLFCADEKLPQVLQQGVETKPKRFVRWLENLSLPKAIMLILLLPISIIFLRFIVGLVGYAIVAVFPTAWEAQIGEISYHSMRLEVFQESRLAQEKRRVIVEKAQIFKHTGLVTSMPQIEFHASDKIGANALAFPGGPIVITDELVKILGSDDYVLAIIAHEIAHIEERHALHRMADVIGTWVIISAIVGGGESLLEELVFVGFSFWTLSNSREYERAADLSALALLEDSGLSGQNLVAALDLLRRSQCKQDSETQQQTCLTANDGGWLQTHPTTQDRIAYLNEALAD